MKPAQPLGRALAWSTVGSAASRMVGAGGGVLAARALTPTGRGDLAVLVVLGAMGSIIGAAGVQFWITREVARTHSLGLGAAVAWRHSLAVGAAFLALAASVAPFVVGRIVSADAYAALTADAITGAIALAVLAIPNGARAMGIFAVAMTAGATAYAVGVGSLFIVGGDVAAVLWCAVLGNVVSVIVVLFALQPHRAARTVSRALAAQGWRHGVRFGFAGGLGELLLFGMLRVDFLILAAFRPAAEVGAYAIATSLTEMLWIAADASAHVALPAAADGADRAAAERLPAVFRVTTAVGILAAIVVSVTARPVIELLFGPAYGDGAGAVPFLAVAAVVGGGWKILAAEVIGGRGTQARLTTAGVGIAAMVAVDLLLVPTWGMRGAGIGAAVGYIAAAALIVRIWRCESGRSARELVGLRRGDLASIFPTSQPMEAVGA